MKYLYKVRKILIVSAILSLLTNSLFASSPKEETYYIKNNLNSAITIIGEYKVPHLEKHWNQDISEINVWVSSSLESNQKDVLDAGKEWYYISFYPAGDLSSFMGNRTALLSEPLIDKMREIFASFEVYDSDGKLLFNLNTLEKVHVEQKRDDRFVFVVDDYLYK